MKLFGPDPICGDCARKEHPDASGVWYWCPRLEMAVSAKMKACKGFVIDTRGARDD